VKGLPHPVLSAALLVLWLLLANDFSAGQWVLGALLGWLIPFATTRFWPEAIRIKKPRVLLRFLGIVAWDILLGSVRVAWLILRGPKAVQPRFVVVPLDLQSDLAISLFANTISLTPGTVSVEVAADRASLVVHALDCADADAAIADMKARYEAPLKEVFE
jgi:multicomponent K+:H+ antiporter subunit E